MSCSAYLRLQSGASKVSEVIRKRINCLSGATIGLIALVNNDSILEFEQGPRHSHVCLSIDQIQQYSGTAHYSYRYFQMILKCNHYVCQCVRKC